MIELSDEQVFIYGRPNFTCSAVAKLLIAAGVYAAGPSKAEYEQAVYIHWASELFIEHGEVWRNVANEILEAASNKISQPSNDN